MENGSETKKRYRAFISYSQLDKKWAKKLHQALESYRVPLGVVAQIDTSSRRIGRIFRDEDEMGASESLGAALEGALDDSESLIVICSPNSAKSEWVDMEVKRFKRNPQAQILAVIVAGKPNSGDEQTECFCPALRFRADANGELTDIPDEPLAPDLRKDGLGKLTTRLVAGILGVSFDELWNREQRRRFAARLKFTGLVAATMLGITAIGGQYLRNQNAERASQIINFSRLAMQDAMTLQLEADRASGFERGLRFAVMASRTSTLHPEQPAARKLLRFGAQRSRALGTMTGHRGGVQYAGFMQNAENVVSWGKDNFIRIWQVRTGQLISEHQISGRIIAADASSTQLVVSDDRGGLSVLRTIDMQRTTLSEREQLVQDLAAFDVTGTLLVTAARSGSVVTLWDTKANRTLGSFVPGWEMPLAAIKLSNDGSLLAVACLDGTLKVWNSKTRELVLAADTEVSRKHSLTFAPDNSVIVSNYRGKSSLFNIEHGKLLGLIEGKVVYSPDASHIAVVNEDNNIEIRKSDSAQLISTLKGHQDVINNVAFGNDGKLLVSASADTTARLWDIGNETQLALFEGHLVDVKTAVLNTNNSRVLSYAADNKIRIFDATPREQAKLQRSFSNDGYQPRKAKFDQSIKRLITAGSGKKAIIWNTETGKPVHSFESSRYGVDEVAFSDDGDLAIITGIDGSAALVDTVSGEELYFFAVSQQTVEDKKIFITEANPSLSRVITPGESGKANIWNSNTGEIISTLSPQDEQFALFKINRDGNRAVSLSWEGISRVWDTESGVPISTLKGHVGLIESADFSFDGNYIATAGQDNTASVWDASSGAELFKIAGFDGSVLRVKFSHDSKRLAISSSDGSVRLWDIDQQQEIVRMVGHTDGVKIVIFDQTDQFLVTGSWDHSVRVWDVLTGLEVAKIDLRNSDLNDLDVSPGAHRVAIADLAGPALVWEIAKNKGVGETGHGGDMAWWRDKICDPEEGKLPGMTRLLTREDILAAPILDGLEGKDVCELVGASQRIKTEMNDAASAQAGQLNIDPYVVIFRQRFNRFI